MTWPSQTELVNAIDLSYYNQVNQQTPPVIIDVPRFCAANPDIGLVFIRACWPSGFPDPLYPVYYDAFTSAGVRVAAYLWPNVTKTLVTTRDNWRRALGDRVPKLIALDFEEPSYGANIDALTYNANASLELAFNTFQRPVIGYGRANWMESHFRAGFERNWKWWVAHYPLPIPNGDGTWRQYRTHAELAQHLPIGNTFTPYLGRRLTQDIVAGWQFSEYLFPSPTIWSRRIDGNSFKKSFVESVYGSVPLPPTPPPQLSLEEKVALLWEAHPEIHPTE